MSHQHGICMLERISGTSMSRSRWGCGQVLLCSLLVSESLPLSALDSMVVQAIAC